MHNTHLNSVPAVEKLPVKPYQLTPDERETVIAACAELSALDHRAEQIRPAAIACAADNAAAQFIAGKIPLESALAVLQLKGVSDQPIRRANNALANALAAAVNRQLAAARPVAIAAIADRAEQLRELCNAIQNRELDDAEAAGIPHEPSMTLRRMQETYRREIARLRELRDDNALPSRAEVRDL